MEFLQLPEEYQNRIKEAAKQNQTVREALHTIFPEVFTGMHFKAGSIFYLTDDYYKRTSSCPEKRIQEASACQIFLTNFDGQTAPISRLVILIHEKNAHEYRLIHMQTGYHFDGQGIFYRKRPGVYIPEEQRIGLYLFTLGGGK
jgi:hypothetical protein